MSAELDGDVDEVEPDRNISEVDDRQAKTTLTTGKVGAGALLDERKVGVQNRGRGDGHDVTLSLIRVGDAPRFLQPMFVERRAQVRFGESIEAVVVTDDRHTPGRSVQFLLQPGKRVTVQLGEPPTYFELLVTWKQTPSQRLHTKVVKLHMSQH